MTPREQAAPIDTMDTIDRPSVTGRAVVADTPGAGISRTVASPVGNVGYRG